MVLHESSHTFSAFWHWLWPSPPSPWLGGKRRHSSREVYGCSGPKKDWPEPNQTFAREDQQISLGMVQVQAGVHCGRFFFHETGWKAWCCMRMNAAVSVPPADRCFFFLQIHFEWLQEGKNSSTNKKISFWVFFYLPGTGAFSRASWRSTKRLDQTIQENPIACTTSERQRVNSRPATWWDCTSPSWETIRHVYDSCWRNVPGVQSSYIPRTWGGAASCASCQMDRGQPPHLDGLVGFVVALFFSSLMVSICVYPI